MRLKPQRKSIKNAVTLTSSFILACHLNTYKQARKSFLSPAWLCLASSYRIMTHDANFNSSYRTSSIVIII